MLIAGYIFLANLALGGAFTHVVGRIGSARKTSRYGHARNNMCRNINSRYRCTRRAAASSETEPSMPAVDDLTVSDLKAVYRKLGGVPGNLRKGELLTEVKLKLQKILDERRSATAKSSDHRSSHDGSTTNDLNESTVAGNVSNNVSVNMQAQDPRDRRGPWQREREVSNRGRVNGRERAFGNSRRTDPSSGGREKEFSTMNRDFVPRSSFQGDRDARQQQRRPRLLPRIPNPHLVAHWNNNKGPSDFDEKWLLMASVGVEKYQEHPLLKDREARIKRMPLTDMEVTFLGTASCIPGVSRGVSSIALRRLGDIWIFDAGEATQIQIQRSSIKPTKITKIFMTHVHGDHTFGLPGLLCLMGRAKMEGENVPPVEIYGPAGLRLYLRATMRWTQSRITARYIVHELHGIPHLHGDYTYPIPPHAYHLEREAAYGEIADGSDIWPNPETGLFDLFNDAEVTVLAGPMKHTVPCVGFVITEADRQGSIQADGLWPVIERNAEAIREEYGYRDPKRIMRNIKESYTPGGTFTFPGDGTTFQLDDIIAPPRAGRKIVVCGDTCDSSSLSEVGRNADLLIHEATNACLKPFDNDGYYSVEKQTVAHGHSTPYMAARFAESIKARQLVMTHFSPRYHGDDRVSSVATMERIARQARRVGNFQPHQVVTAWDLLSVPVLTREQWGVYTEIEEAAQAEEHIAEKAFLEDLASQQHRHPPTLENSTLDTTDSSIASTHAEIDTTNTAGSVTGVRVIDLDPESALEEVDPDELHMVKPPSSFEDEMFLEDEIVPEEEGVLDKNSEIFDKNEEIFDENVEIFDKNEEVFKNEGGREEADSDDSDDNEEGDDDLLARRNFFGVA